MNIQTGFISRIKKGYIMNIVENYKLIYDGAGMHEILGIVKSKLYASLAKRASSKALAEHFLNMVRFESDFRQSHFIEAENYSAKVSKSNSKLMRQVDHIHENCAQEIRSKWDAPQLTDEEVADMLYADKIEKELAKISDKITVKIAI